MSSNNPNYQKEYIKQHYLDNKQYYIDKSNARRQRLSIERRLFESVRQRAKSNNIPFNIEESDIIIPEFCPVFNTPFDKSVYYRPSVDRIVPELGYIKGNIAVISYRANWLKNNSTPEELEALLKWVKSLSS